MLRVNLIGTTHIKQGMPSALSSTDARSLLRTHVIYPVTGIVRVLTESLRPLIFADKWDKTVTAFGKAKLIPCQLNLGSTWDAIPISQKPYVLHASLSLEDQKQFALWLKQVFANARLNQHNNDRD